MITDKDKFEQFKRDLRSYSFKQKELKLIEDELIRLSAILHEAGAVRYDEEKLSFGDPYITKYLDEMDEYDELEARKGAMEAFLSEVDAILQKCEFNVREALIECYIKGKPHDVVAQNYLFFHRQQMYRDMERELKGIL